MCGIAGYLGESVSGLLDRMIEAIRPRGPDAEGRSTLPGVHIGHTRLSIVDIEGGSQPMIRENGRFIISYNGEIYNYTELRAKIEATGRSFTTHSDTELLPLGFAAFGTELFEQLIGIFAFALYDTQDNSLYLVRDHFGVKPLYYAPTQDGIAFSSTARAVALHPDVDRSLHEGAVRDFLQYRYVPNGQHFFRGIETLPPGHYLKAVLGQRRVEVVPFWQPKRRTGTSTCSREEWIDKTEALLQDAMALQLRSDVPVGLFLSGGVDSSTVAQFASKRSKYGMAAYTFSMGGADDEVAEARRIADSVGASHTVVAVDNTSDYSQFYDAVACMDIPVGDAILLPTYQLCQAAARDVKVVLTGEGADEVFGGYVHFSALCKLTMINKYLPGAHHLAPLVKLLPIPLLNRFFDYQASLGELGRHKLSHMIASLPRSEGLYRITSSIIDDRDITAAANLGEPLSAGDMDLSLPGMMFETVRTWLPNQILNKMDQLSMAHGLEARVPFLDPRLYEHLLSAPDNLIDSGGENKILLRQVLRRHTGNWKRQKFAFHVPVETRYRPALEKLIAAWLSPETTRKHGILRQDFIDENRAYLARGDFIASKRLMAMVALHMWLDANGSYS